MSDKKRTCEPIATPTTIGEFREATKLFPDDMDFGFLNQPIQTLHKYEHDDYHAVVFQPSADDMRFIGDKAQRLVGFFNDYIKSRINNVDVAIKISKGSCHESELIKILYS